MLLESWRAPSSQVPRSCWLFSITFTCKNRQIHHMDSQSQRTTIGIRQNRWQVDLIHLRIIPLTVSTAGACLGLRPLALGLCPCWYLSACREPEVPRKRTILATWGDDWVCGRWILVAGVKLYKIIKIYLNQEREIFDIFRPSSDCRHSFPLYHCHILPPKTEVTAGCMELSPTLLESLEVRHP